MMMRRRGFRTSAVFAAALACAACGAAQFSPRIVGLAEAGPGEAVRLAETQFRQGNVALALQQYRKAMREAPGDIDAVIGIAACYDRMGRFELSRRYYEEALAIDPGDRRARHNFALSLRLQGRGEEAARFVAEAAPSSATVPATSVAALPTPAVEAPARASKPTAMWLERLSLGEVAIVIGSGSAIPARAAQGPPPDTHGAALVRATGKEVEWRLDDAPGPPPVMAPRVRAARPAVPATATRSAPSAAAVSVAKSVPVPGASQNLRLLNGVGRRGLAARMWGYIGSEGWNGVAVGDASLRLHRSLIVYPRGARAAAARLADRLPFPTQLREGAGGREVRLMLGRDSLEFDDRMQRWTAAS